MDKKPKKVPHPENLLSGERYYVQYEEDGMITLNQGIFLEFYTRLEDEPKPKYDVEGEKSSPTPIGFKNVLYLKFKKYVTGTDNKSRTEYFHIPYRQIKELA